MNLTLHTAPAQLPIDIDTARQFLRITDTSTDPLILNLIAAATSFYDGWGGILGRAMVTQTWELALDAFPDEAINIPLGPLQSVTAITYVDAAGSTQTVPGASYYVDTRSIEGWVIPNAGYAWPEAADVPNGVIVRFVCGYGAPAAIPAAVRQAMMLRLRTLFNVAGRDPSLRRETVDGVGSFDYDVSGQGQIMADRVEDMLIAPFRRVPI